MPRNTNPRRPRAQKAAASVEAIQHQDTRTNIPTEQLKDFLPDEPAKQFRYPRDPSLDPQLVWKGKDELDGEDLTGWLRPIFIQEKIHPRALIEDLRKQSQERSGGGDQLNFFADFNGLSNFEEKVEFYQHQQHWSNRMILGDSLMVMASLAEKEGLRGRVQTIYLDPPYGIKFGSNWQVSTRKRDVRDGRADGLTRQPEQVRAFRDTWQQGIHSYLTYLRDRFTVARDLLTESGSIFVQIGDENVHLVRNVLDEVFGSENFCSFIIFRKTTTQAGDLLPDTNDYVLWYAKVRDRVKSRDLFQEREGANWVNYDFVREPDGAHRRMSREESRGETRLTPGALVYRRSPMTSASRSESTSAPLEFQSQTFFPGGGGWKTNVRGFRRLVQSERIESYGRTLAYRRYVTDFPYFPFSNTWMDTASGGYGDDKVYVVQTNAKVIARCLLMTTDPGDLVLDPTCGSGTTAYVAEQWGRRWITIDTSRVALALARTRLMSAQYRYYLLADSEAGRSAQNEVLGEGMVNFSAPTTNDVRQGFVYKRVPHIQLRDIANNDEIDGIWERWQARLEPLRATLNKALGESWEEWQIPREAGEGWTASAVATHRDWWEARCARQREIDESIARHSESEVLYDQPYEDSKRVRVAGPFTVESLSPHRVLDPEEQEEPAAEREAKADPAQPGWEALVIEHLRSAGIQNTKRGERLKFVRLERHANPWLHAVGEWEQDGVPRRIAVSIGSEYGTVGSDWVKEAAKEALKGAGFDLLAVCAIAFDGNAAGAASEFQPSPPAPLPRRGRGEVEREGERSGFAIAEAERQYGRLPVVLVRVNPDLAMGDDLLKKTGAGNLFTVFGEPDIKIKHEKGGMLTAAISGLDIYDPTTGEVRSSKGTDDIACWFIDTEYDGESFFVRHAYFTGADEPYERLQRALRAEVDEEAWASLYRSESRPFPIPASGRIAVKVINHYGDEVLKVYEV